MFWGIMLANSLAGLATIVTCPGCLSLGDSKQLIPSLSNKSKLAHCVAGS
jgi:hypothetical protein